MPISPETIDQRTANSYDFVRFFAAACVLFSHHFDLAGYEEPIVPGYGKDFGELGVDIFFCLSGFLICLSLQRSSDWIRFFAARFFRIVPNLAFVLIVTSLATLLWYRNGANLGAHIAYVADNLMMFVRGVSKTIPGVFTDAKLNVVNEPLWTLPYELWCYVLLAAVFFVGRRFAGGLVIVSALSMATLWSIASSDAFAIDLEFTLGPLESEDFFRLGASFLSGATIAVFWRRLSPYALPLGLAGFVLVVLAQRLTEDSIGTSFALAAAVVGLGSSRAMAWFARGGDASYGMYVFGWPVAQFALLLVPDFWTSMLAAFSVTIAIGYATWHGFEKRAMRYPARIARALRG